MSARVAAWAAPFATAPLIPHAITRREPGPGDVRYRFVIDIASLK